MTQLVTIFGGSGFVGRYIAQHMAQAGWRVRVAVRRPNEALFVKPYGVVGQVEPIFCNIRDEASVAAALIGADAVVNCVGTFDQFGKNNFEAVQYRGAQRIAQLASAHGVAHMVHLSAIGADPGGESIYARSKAAGEAGVQEAFPNAVILRPSVIFGPEDQFFNRFAAMARMSPFIPVFGANTLFQPVYVNDVAKAAVLGAQGMADGGVYELGGPRKASFRALMIEMLHLIERRRVVLSLPFWLGAAMGSCFDLLSRVSGGLVKGPVTSDQVRSLRRDNVVDDGAKGFATLSIEPTALEAILPEYLWHYRPSGQYAEIKKSAKQLR